MGDGDVSIEQKATKEPVTRRNFMRVAALSGAGLTSVSNPAQLARSTGVQTAIGQHAMPDELHMNEEIKKEKIRRAMLAGPSSVTAEATVAEMDPRGDLTVLRAGKNEWVCIPGDQNGCCQLSSINRNRCEERDERRSQAPVTFRQTAKERDRKSR